MTKALNDEIHSFHEQAFKEEQAPRNCTNAQIKKLQSLEITNGRPLCPKCKAPMWGVHVGSAKTADDKRTFQCPRCEHSQAVRFTTENMSALSE
jgi:hypothetical protein